MREAAMREIIAQEIKDKFEAHVLYDGPRRMLCFHWAAISYLVLKGCGLRAIIQGGRASWPIPGTTERIIYPFNPKIHTWTPDSPMVPIHAWVALPDTRELIDMAYGDVVREYQEKGGAWQEGKKDYLWFDVETKPPLVEYIASTEGNHVVLDIIQDAYTRGKELMRHGSLRENLG